MLKKVTDLVNELGALFDAVAGLAPGTLQNEIGIGIAILTGFGFLHVANVGAFTQAIFALVSAILAAGVAIERAISATKNPLTKFDLPPFPGSTPVVK